MYILCTSFGWWFQSMHVFILVFSRQLGSSIQTGEQKETINESTLLFFSYSKHSARHCWRFFTNIQRSFGLVSGKSTIKKHHRLRIIYSTTWFHVFTVAGKFLVSCIYNYMHIAAAYIHIDIVRWNQQIKLKWLNHASSPINTNNMFNQVFNQCLQKAPRSFACRLLGPSNYFDITTIIPRSMYCSCEPTCF